MCMNSTLKYLTRLLNFLTQSQLKSSSLHQSLASLANDDDEDDVLSVVVGGMIITECYYCFQNVYYFVHSNFSIMDALFTCMFTSGKKASKSKQRSKGKILM